MSPSKMFTYCCVVVYTAKEVAELFAGSRMMTELERHRLSYTLAYLALDIAAKEELPIPTVVGTLVNYVTHDPNALVLYGLQPPKNYESLTAVLRHKQCTACLVPIYQGEFWKKHYVK